MKKSLNYFLSFFAFASILFLASCGDDGEIPLPGDDSITLATDDDRIQDDTLRAAPGESIEITATLGVGSDGDITVVTNDPNVVEVPTPNTISSGDAITVTIPEDAQLNAMANLTFSSGNINEQITVVVGYEYNTVVELLEGNDDYTLLVEALEAANLTTTLSGTGPYTVFAPDNAAFATAGFESIDDLPTDEAELAAILQYHVIEGLVLAEDLAAGEVTTLGGPVTVTIDGENVMINDANVTATDMMTGNGVVHTIDNVIMPEDVTTYEAFLLAAPTGALTSETFFSTSSGELYSYNDVVGTEETLSPTIDFGYAYGATDNATLAAPSAYPSYVGYDMTRWSTLNATAFRTTNLDADAFEAIVSGNDIEAEFEVGTEPANPNRVIGLTAGTVLAFQTADNRYGLIQVVELVDGNGDGQFDGSSDGIEIAVKVTQ